MKRLVMMTAVLALGGGVAAPMATANSQPDPERMVVGGEVDASADVGWIAALSESGRYMCSGSLVAPTYVLTAAHCTQFTRARQWTVRLNSKDRTDGGVVRRVRRILEFPRYGFNHGDMALLRLRRSVALEPVGLVPRGTRWVGDSAYMAGWGRTAANDQRVPRWLRSASIPIQPDRVCRTAYGRRFFDGRFMLCAGYRRPASCLGDSGGPLARSLNGAWQLVGVTSIGKRKCNRPAGYAWVGSKPLRKWLRKTLGT
jgi:trypsin